MNNKFSYRELVKDAESKQKSIGHFNVSTLEMVHGVVNGAIAMNAPVIIGVSEGEREFMGQNEIVSLIKTLREKFNHPIFLNADHTYSFNKVKEAVEMGFDSVIFDGADKSYEENLENTIKCVNFVKEFNKNNGTSVLIEAELGFIGKSSKVLDGIPEGVKLENLTSPDEALDFVTKSGIDFFAPAVGNIHGMLKGGVDPALNLKRIAEIKGVVNTPLVLHGGSGSSEADLIGASRNGCSIIHVSTELRVAYRSALLNALSTMPDEVSPYKYMRPSVKAIETVVSEKIKILGYTL